MSIYTDHAVEDLVAMGRFNAAEIALHNALGCDAYRQEIEAARRAAMRLADECERLAGDLSVLSRKAPSE